MRSWEHTTRRGWQSAVLATVLVTALAAPAHASRDTGSWTVERALDECVHAGVSLFTEDRQGGRSKTYCLDLGLHIGSEARSMLITTFPSQKPASLRLMVVSGCRLETSFPRFDAKTHRNVDALEAPPGRRTRVRDIPERFDGQFKVGRFKVYCRGSTGAVAVETDDESGVAPADEPVLLSGLVGVVTSLPALLWPDAAAPASVADFVPAVREQVWANASEGFRVPLHLRFIEARCTSEGGVALLFEEIGPPLVTRTYAYAVRGSRPTSTDDAWSGGYGLSSVLDDPEFMHLMGSHTFLCP